MMKTTRHGVSAAIVASALLACVAAHAAEPCLAHYSTDGPVTVGRTYRSWDDFPDVAPHEAFERALAFTRDRSGFTLKWSSEEQGRISATIAMTHALGRTMPLEIRVQPEGGGSRISISFEVMGGLVISTDRIKAHFCNTLQAVAQP